MMSTSLSGIGLIHLDVEHVDPGELLEQAALALHHRLARPAAPMLPRPSTAVPFETTATRLDRLV